jgi:C-terminal processing protease CtpA/Prc
MSMRRLSASVLPVLAVLAVVLLPAPAAAAPTPLDRLTQLGKLWGTVRYLHPALAYKEIDWDAALVRALPRVEAAKDREEYGAAVQAMLAEIGDPLTRVVPEEAAPAETAPAPAAGQAPTPLTRQLDDGTMVVALGPGVRTTGFRDLQLGVNAAFQEIARQKAVIVDLRGVANSEGIDAELLSILLNQLAPVLAGRPAVAPSQRFLVRSGYLPQEGGTSGGYYFGFITPAALTFAPSPDLPVEPKRVVFLVDRRGTLPPLALALQAAGDGRIVAEGALDEESAVTRRDVPLGEGWIARVRVSEIVPRAGWPGVHADAQVPEGSAPDAALAAATAELKKDGWGATPLAGAPAPSLPDAIAGPDKTYPEMLAPDLAHRRLAVIRAWNVIHFFYPYLHLIGDWDAVLPELLARMEKAETARDYAAAVMEMMARVPDGHTNVFGHPEMAKILGEIGLPLAVRWVEGKAVIVAVGGDEARTAGLQPGDAILAVDGEAVPARIERLSRYVTASTPAARVDRICGSALLRGPEGPAVLTVEGADGRPREVRLTRQKGVRPVYPPKGEVVRLLPGNLGYVDLTRLTTAEVPAMFERLKDTRALILDMRGYPQGTAWSIAPRINAKHARIGAQFRRAQLAAFSTDEADAGYYFSQPLPPLPPGTPLYTAPTVMLIDDRAISQAEHTGLFFEAASGTKLIGTPTAGANGDVTTFTLPGGITATFTGHDVRHADGRQLQRVGLQPDVEVSPTRQGLREGRDEVLERAVEFLGKE